MIFGSVFRLLPDAAHCLWLHEPEPVRKELRAFLKIIYHLKSRKD